MEDICANKHCARTVKDIRTRDVEDTIGATIAIRDERRACEAPSNQAMLASRYSKA
jgi:hypothetical protein